jgi:type II secretory ATPase GspE/PulE/Tfp pilus assembly ATPase PilB-like protein
MGQSAPQIVDDLVLEAEAAGASDIHLHMNGKAAQVAFRLDGLMTPTRILNDEVAELVFGRIKYLARLKTSPRMGALKNPPSGQKTISASRLILP